MKRLLATTLLAAFAGASFAHGNVSCPVVPKEEMKGQMELQKKLEGEGWKVRKVQNYNGCYEVYGFDAQGKKAEAFFHPKTFERVYPEGEQPTAAPAK
jgi:hypothetical protein